MMRLNKYLAQSGVASRRSADLLISQGKIKLNGEIVTEMGIQIEPERDLIEIDGKPVNLRLEYEYLILNKPPGFLTTVRDPFNRSTVMELLPKNITRLYPVGRLDLDTSGLLLFTNDGEMALALTHPRHFVEKEYLTKVTGVPTDKEIRKLTQGILLDDGMTAPAKLAIEKIENGNAIIRIKIREGRKRQVKRMMQAIGHRVISLHRIRMGPLALGDLKPGEYRRPTEQELAEMMKIKEMVKRS